MNTQDVKKLPLVLGHRGASAQAPENTLAAFQLAYDQGADGIELDVMLSHDKKLVVIHDGRLERTTDGEGLVKEFDYSDLKSFNAAAKFKNGWNGTETLPLLDEVFELLGGKILINVELKNFESPFDDLTERVIALVEKYGIEEDILLSSFNPLNLPRAKRCNPHIKRGLLTEGGSVGAAMRGLCGRLFPYDALHPYFKDVTMPLVRGLHGRGKNINVWTVDNSQELLAMKDLGVDMIITNDPLNARKILFG